MASSQISSVLLQGSTVQAELLKALKHLVLLQPEDPINFLGKHFESLVRPSGEPSQECVELLRDAVSLDSGQLDSVLYKTFTLLQENTVSSSSRDVLAGRVPGNNANNLLQELCGHLPLVISDSLLSKLHVVPEASLSYTEFTSVLSPYFKLQGYLRMAREVFESLDAQGTGSINRGTGEELLSQLRACVTSSSVVISASEVTAITRRAGQSEKTMTKTEFESTAGQLFVEHLPPASH